MCALPEDHMMEGSIPTTLPPDSVEAAVELLEAELGSMFGPTGKFIVRKQIELFKNGQPLTMDDIPKVIDRIADVIRSLIGPVLTKEFRKRARKKCGLPI